VGDFNAFERVLDLLLTIGGVGIDEILVNRETDKIDSVVESVALQLLQILPVGRGERVVLPHFHLTVHDIHTFNAQGGGFVRHRLNRNLGRPEVPIRIAGNRKLGTPGCGRC